jgi:hypothetical protein
MVGLSTLLMMARLVAAVALRGVPLLGDRFSASSQVKGDVDEHVFLGATTPRGPASSIEVIPHDEIGGSESTCRVVYCRRIGEYRRPHG